MKATLFALALNELLDRPSSISFNAASVFLSFATQDLILLFREACLTPELTGRAHNAATAKFSIKGKLTRAPVQ
jgi:hypothetical protein